MIARHVLDNGAVVLIDEMQDVRSFSLGIFVRAGSGHEPAARRGLSHYLEHLLFKRTRRRTNAEISRVIDSLGGDVDAFTTKEYTGFYVHTLDARFDEALDLMGDVVLSPAFGAADVETERGVILEEIGEANDNPDDLVHETFVELLLARPPARRADPRHHPDGPGDRQGRHLRLLPLALRPRQSRRRARRPYSGARPRGDRAASGPAGREGPAP